jgi:HEAT repeat protein
VRRAAVLALGNLEYEPGPQQGTGIKLSEELLRELDARYRSDPSELVRAEIVKGVALTSTHSTVRSQLLVDALKDPSTQVIQYALIGIGEGHVAEGLPDCVGLLKHSSRVLRMDAAQAIAANGADATAYINDLRAALSSETDPLVAKTLHGAIDALAQTAK